MMTIQDVELFWKISFFSFPFLFSIYIILHFPEKVKCFVASSYAVGLARLLGPICDSVCAVERFFDTLSHFLYKYYTIFFEKSQIFFSHPSRRNKVCARGSWEEECGMTVSFLLRVFVMQRPRHLWCFYSYEWCRLSLCTRLLLRQLSTIRDNSLIFSIYIIPQFYRKVKISEVPRIKMRDPIYFSMSSTVTSLPHSVPA